MIVRSWAWIALVGCGPIPGLGGQSGEEMGVTLESVDCDTAERVPLALDEEGPGGFSAMDLVDGATGAYTGPLIWEDGSTATLSLQVDGPGREASRVVSACQETLEVVVPVSAITDDDRLDLSVDAILWGDPDGPGLTFVWPDPAGGWIFGETELRPFHGVLTPIGEVDGGAATW